jgi:flagellar hook-length control protein FliK
MSQSTVLPPMQPKAADLAASSGRPASAADEAAPDGASFGDVLQLQIDKGNAVEDVPVVATLPPPELFSSTDAAAPDVQIDPGLMNPVPAIAVAALVVPTFAPPNTVAPVAEPPDQPVISKPTVVGVSSSLPAVVDVRPDATPAPRLVEAAEAGAVRARPDPDGPVFDRQLIASGAGDPTMGPKAVAESPQPITEAKPAAASAPVTQVANPNQVIAAAEPRHETNAGRSLKVDVAQPLASPGWRDSFAERVTWVAAARQPSAEMQINPPNLGPVEIRVSMNADQASLSFFSPHAAVREAIQAALPRLIDGFSASGLTLGNVFVGTQSQSDQNPGQSGQGAPFAGRAGENPPSMDVIRQVTWLQPGVGLGRVDLFA